MPKKREMENLKIFTGVILPFSWESELMITRPSHRTKL